VKTLFSRAGRRVFPALALLALLGTAVSHPAATQVPPAPARLALVGARIYPSPAEPPIPDGVVLIEDGKIAAVGPKGKVNIPRNVSVLDCVGLALTAGLWNSHVHFGERKWDKAAVIPAAELAQQLQDMLTRFGFTTVFDTGSLWTNTRTIRQRIESREVPGPRIFSTGEIIFPKGGTPPADWVRAFRSFYFAMPEVETPEQGTEAARQMLDAGVDAIKIYAATWRPPIVAIPLDTVKAITAEAHRRGKLVLAHPSNRQGLNAAIEGGADVLVHTAPISGVWDAALLAKMKQKNIALVPTLKLWKYETRHDRASLVAGFIDKGIDQLRAYAQAGGIILFGTDVGYMDDYDPTDEYAMMAQAGMSFPQILASLTTAPAQRFGESKHTGRIAPGMDANLVVLEADPAKDVRAFAKVRYTLRGGRLIYRAE